MELLQRYVLEERDEIMDNDIRLTAIGLVDHLPIFVRKPLFDLIEESSKNKHMWLCLALSYGSREDIVSAVKTLINEVQAGELRGKDIDEEAIRSRLSTSMLPPLDLVIRSSGEQRLSNFLLWEAAYAEFLFSETMWPDFRKEHLQEALATYQSRERRFGRTSAQIATP